VTDSEPAVPRCADPECFRESRGNRAQEVTKPLPGRAFVDIGGRPHFQNIHHSLKLSRLGKSAEDPQVSREHFSVIDDA
jgi:hypothetical protein